MAFSTTTQVTAFTGFADSNSSSGNLVLTGYSPYNTISRNGGLNYYLGISGNGATGVTIESQSNVAVSVTTYAETSIDSDLSRTTQYSSFSSEIGTSYTEQYGTEDKKTLSRTSKSERSYTSTSQSGSTLYAGTNAPVTDGTGNSGTNDINSIYPVSEYSKALSSLSLASIVSNDSVFNNTQTSSASTTITQYTSEGATTSVTSTTEVTTLTPATRQSTTFESSATIEITALDYSVIPIFTTQAASTKLGRGSLGQTAYKSAATISTPTIVGSFTDADTVDLPVIAASDAVTTDTYTWVSSYLVTNPQTITRVISDQLTTTVTSQGADGASYSTGIVESVYSGPISSAVTVSVTSSSQGSVLYNSKAGVVSRSSVFTYPGAFLSSLVLSGYPQAVAVELVTKQDPVITTVEVSPLILTQYTTSSSSTYASLLTSSTSLFSRNRTIKTDAGSAGSVTGVGYSPATRSAKGFNNAVRHLDGAVAPSTDMSTGYGIGLSGPNSAFASNLGVDYSSVGNVLVFPYEPNGQTKSYDLTSQTNNFTLNSSLDSATWFSNRSVTQASGSQTITVTSDSGSTSFVWGTLVADVTQFDSAGIDAPLGVLRNGQDTCSASYTLNGGYAITEYDSTGGSSTASYTSGGSYSLAAGGMVIIREIPFYQATN